MFENRVLRIRLGLNWTKVLVETVYLLISKCNSVNEMKAIEICGICGRYEGKT